MKPGANKHEDTFKSLDLELTSVKSDENLEQTVFSAMSTLSHTESDLLLPDIPQRTGNVKAVIFNTFMKNIV